MVSRLKMMNIMEIFFLHKINCLTEITVEYSRSHFLALLKVVQNSL